MRNPASLVRARLERLAETLTTLRERVRDAVAGELGQAIGDAVRDLLTTLLRDGLPSRTPRPERDPWADDDPERDAWADYADDADCRANRRRAETTHRHSGRWPAAVTLGAAVARWLLSRRAPVWAGLGLGLLAVLAALTHGPAADAAAAAADLVSLTRPLGSD